MKKLFFALAIWGVHGINAMAQQPPTIQNRTIIIPTRGTNASPYDTPIRGHLGPVQGGLPPYTFQRLEHPGMPLEISPTGVFRISAFKLPASFQYTVTDSQGLTSTPATIRLEPGANIQGNTPGLIGNEPG